MEEFEKLTEEVRQEFHIPPYFEDEGILRFLKEGKVQLDRLNPGRKIEEDGMYRMLLKNYANYAYHGKVHEFWKNYGSTILMWQLGSEINV